MDLTTTSLLHAEADLHTYGQTHATDRKGIAKRFRARGRAVDAWVRAGCPDLPSGAAKPAVMPKAVSEVNWVGGKDWTPVNLVLEVVRTTERGALLTDGTNEGWAPRDFIQDADRNPCSVHVGDVGEMYVPMWCALEAGWA